ncbi:MAG: hypothetical protein KGM44_10770, partial [bacterium]|nr:hypothetical protein [bacterium]
MTLLASALTALVVLGGLSRFEHRSRAWRAGWWTIVSVLTLFFLSHVARTVLANFAHPPYWDFHAFWLYGRTALLFHNVYDPANIRHVSDTPLPGVLMIGFPYPPPAILLVLPMALFTDPRASLTVWYGMHFLALALVVVL